MVVEAGDGRGRLSMRAMARPADALLIDAENFLKPNLQLRFILSNWEIERRLHVM
jgi:hypothetical protein